jgi:hypothetical protein
MNFTFLETLIQDAQTAGLIIFASLTAAYGRFLGYKLVKDILKRDSLADELNVDQWSGVTQSSIARWRAIEKAENERATQQRYSDMQAAADSKYGRTDGKD